MAAADNLLAYFWDIQNCPLPETKDPVDCVLFLRNQFRHCGGETEFTVVCDVTKEHVTLMTSLDIVDVTIQHVPSGRKNAADQAIKKRLEKFGSDYHGLNATVIIISSDQDFGSHINSLRNQHLMQVILLHGHNVNQQLLKLPNKHYNLYDLLKDVPNSVAPTVNETVKSSKQLEIQLVASKAATKVSHSDVVRRLRQIFTKCAWVTYDPATLTAVAEFSDLSDILKARYMHGTDCYGYKVSLLLPECEKWVQLGECPNKEHCEKLHIESWNKGSSDAVGLLQTTNKDIKMSFVDVKVTSK